MEKMKNLEKPLNNTINPNLCHHAGHNPVVYIDSDGNLTLPFTEKHRNRNQHNKLPVGNVLTLLKKQKWKKPQYSDADGNIWSLRLSKKSVFHGKENLVFESKDDNGGSYELVVDQEGNIVNGSEGSTYNYTDSSSIFGHFFDDVFPHLLDQGYNNNGDNNQKIKINGDWHKNRQNTSNNNFKIALLNLVVLGLFLLLWLS